MVFPVVMYRCESWTIRKAERWRINAFELWCWRWLLSIRWTARRSNQYILKEISLEYSLEGLMLKLKINSLSTWCEELTHYYVDIWQSQYNIVKLKNKIKICLKKKKRLICWERLKAGGERDNKEWDGWMASPTQWTWVWASSRRWWWTGKPDMLQSMELQRFGYNWPTALKATKKEKSKVR